jgi:alkanesulfonate monooxygenase SsuD/methylene tetrahydromethanopterin reductase-like flavin-dependent oxidoreductase (luciferase family)
MPVAIQIPSVRDGGAPTAAELSAMLKQAADAGFASAWVMENQLGAVSALEPLSTLAFAAGQTSSMGLGLAVAILALHQPVRLARAAATIDQLSGGRI